MLRQVCLLVSFVVVGAGCQCGPSGSGGDAGLNADGGPSTPADAGAADAGTTLGNCASKTCTSTQVCASNICTECPTGLVACANSCVDSASDNANCGGCGHVCPTGQGCSQNSCIPTLTMGSGPAVCPAAGSGGTSITLPDAGSSCTGVLAQTTFRWGLCACNAITLSGNLMTDGFDSSTGAYRPGMAGGSVGSNGAFQSQGNTHLGGTLWSSDAVGLGVTGVCEMQQELHLGGPLTSSSLFNVGLDAYVNGNVTATGTATVGKTLFVPQNAVVSPSVTAAHTTRGPVTTPEPCDCSPSQIIPVAAIVEHRRTVNDNSTIALNADALANVTSPKRLDLPCGHYFLNSIGASAGVTIVAHGRSILYIGGDVITQGGLTIGADLGAELDVFIEGDLSSSAAIRLGNAVAPARTRIYLASSKTLSLSAQLELGAFLYAPLAPVESSGGIEAFGGIVSGSYKSSATTTLHYDRAVLNLGAECAVPDAGTGPVSCQSCSDCGNQACNAGTCGACTINADCCAPLFCNAGTCVGLN